jgi:hypothetical protein
LEVVSVVQKMSYEIDESPGHYHPAMKPRRRSMCEKSRMSANNREPGWESLAAAIIEQAVVDYFILVRCGAVRRGEMKATAFTTGFVRGGKEMQRYAKKGMTVTDAMELIRFLKNVNKFADAVELSRDWSDMWKHILRLETTGNYRGFLNRKGLEVES